VEAHGEREELEDGREQLVREVEQFCAAADFDWRYWLGDRDRSERARRGTRQLAVW
jgi:hypothetical protein